MKELVKYKSLEKLLNKKITQIAIGEYQIQLNFESNISISIEKSIDIEIRGKKEICYSNKPESSKILLNCVGKKLKSILILNNNSLKLELISDITLIINFIEDGYESYQITVDDDCIIL